MKDPSAIAGGIFCFKKFALLYFLMLIGLVSYSQQAMVTIDDAKKSFGTVMKGELVKLNYVITNTGTVPFLMKDYEVQCSCTSVEFDDKPILPGKSTTVLVKFDTKTVYERQDRVVYINCNTKDGFIKLRFKGNVKKN